MSYYDDSSLFVAPNGYKTSVLFAQKPMDANGQLAFTRSNDTATRVGPDGYIEKVRTNLVRYSEELDNAAWSAVRATATANAATSPDGFSSADKLIPTSVVQTHLFSQSFTSPAAGTYAYSAFFKKGEYDFGAVRITTDTDTKRFGAVVNLTNGVITATNSFGSPTNTSSKVEDYGNGWYRLIVTCQHTSGNITVASTLSPTAVPTFVVSLPQFAGDDTSGVFTWGAQLEASDIATDYIPTTTTAVSVGPVANLPRIDYTGGGCGKLLLEPQRTNVLQQSEYLSSSYFTKNGTSVSTNQTVSPEGVQNASELTEDTSTGTHEITRSITNVVSTSYSISVFAKANTRNWIRLSSADGGFVYFNLSTGEKGTETNATGKIVPFSNGWYRCEITFTASGTNGSATIRIAESDGVISYTGESKSVYLYGFQYETGSYSTSYIPSYGAASTRGADACSKQNIAGTLPTAYPFTLFAECEVTPSDGQALTFSNTASSTEYFTIDFLTGFYRIASRPSTTQDSAVSTLATTLGFHKICGVFTSTTLKLFVDGTLVASGANTQAFNASINDIIIGQLRSVSDTGNRNSVKQSIVFKSALSDAQAIELTTL